MAKAKQKPSQRTITRRRNASRRLAKRRQSPLGRLISDGASTARNINRRLLWLANEWRLEAPPKVGNTVSEELAGYCGKHHINFDWMLDGCLNGLKQMTDDRRGRDRAAQSTAAILAKYAQLTPEHQAIVTAELHRMLAERDQ